MQGKRPQIMERISSRLFFLLLLRHLNLSLSLLHLMTFYLVTLFLNMAFISDYYEIMI